MAIPCTFNKRRYLFYDLTTKETFSVSPEQWQEAKKRFENTCAALYEKRRLYLNPTFIITTETGEHFNWLYRDDEDYSPDHVRGIK